MSQRHTPIWPTDADGRVLTAWPAWRSLSAPLCSNKSSTTPAARNRAGCRLTHEIMLWIVLALGIFTDIPIRQVFNGARRLRLGERTPPRSSLCEARQRLGVAPLVELHRRVVRPLATSTTPGAFFRGWRLMGFDGTHLDAPDTPANRLAFHRANGGRGPGAFPQVRKVSLIELGTHAEIALAIGGWQDGERELCKPCCPRCPPIAPAVGSRLLQLRFLAHRHGHRRGRGGPRQGRPGVAADPTSR